MALGTLGSLVKAFVMGKENKYGKIILYMKVIGKMVKLMEEEDLYMQQGMFMKENGRTIKLMDMEYIQELTDQLILVTGMRINSMDSVYRSGTITLLMRESIFKDISMEQANLFGLMEPFMKVISRKI
jgi:inorganic pyrophosphatase/exopolyphosphatase